MSEQQYVKQEQFDLLCQQWDEALSALQAKQKDLENKYYLLEQKLDVMYQIITMYHGVEK